MSGSNGRSIGLKRDRILVIDDDQPIADLIRDILRKRGFEVDTHAGGASALVQAVEGKYDLIISDYAIPEMNGLEFSRRFRMRKPETGVLIVSGFLDVETVAAFEMEPNVIGWIRKPFDIFDLIRRVEACFASDVVRPGNQLRSLEL